MDTPDFYTPTGRPSKTKHGSTAAYVNFKCRCDRCTEAWRAYMEGRRRANGIKPHPEHAHGTRLMYAADGCRCEECLAANVEYQICVRARLAANTARAALA